MKVGWLNHFLLECPSAMEDPKLPIRMCAPPPTPLPASKRGVKIRTSKSPNGCVSHLSENPNAVGRKTAVVQAANGRRAFDAGKSDDKAFPEGINRETGQPCNSALHACDTLTSQLPAN